LTCNGNEALTQLHNDCPALRNRHCGDGRFAGWSDVADRENWPAVEDGVKCGALFPISSGTPVSPVHGFPSCPGIVSHDLRQQLLQRKTQAVHKSPNFPEFPSRCMPNRVLEQLDSAMERFELPIFIFQGANDVPTPTSQASAYFDDIEAPVKHMEIFSDAGHLPRLCNQTGSWKSC